MGLLSKAILPVFAGTTGVMAYLAAKNPVLSPLAASDPLWGSAAFKKYNPARNPATQDVCVKRIPLGKVRPELLASPGDLVLEYCRGVWSSPGMFLYAQTHEYIHTHARTHAYGCGCI